MTETTCRQNSGVAVPPVGFPALKGKGELETLQKGGVTKSGRFQEGSTTSIREFKFHDFKAGPLDLVNRVGARAVARRAGAPSGTFWLAVGCG